MTIAAVEAGNQATIEITADEKGGEVPHLYTDESGMTFVYPDGRRTVYFASNLLCAHYEPESSDA